MTLRFQTCLSNLLALLAAALLTLAPAQATPASQGWHAENTAGIVDGEGSPGHILLHGLTGCAAAQLQGADCAAGAAAGAAQAMYSGALNGSAVSDQVQRDTAKFIGALVGYATSGGDADNVTVGSSIAESGLVNNRQLHQEELEWIGNNAAQLAKDFGVTEEQAKQLLMQEMLRGVSDDASSMEKRQDVRNWIVQHAPKGGVVDKQNLFAELDRDSDEYKNSILNSRDIATNYELYKTVDFGGGRDASAILLESAIHEANGYYSAAGRDEVLGLLGSISALSDIYSEMSADMLNYPEEYGDVGDASDLARDAVRLQHKAEKLAGMAHIVAVRGSEHFTLAERVGGGDPEVEQYARAYADALAGFSGGVASATMGLSLARVLKARAAGGKSVDDLLKSHGDFVGTVNKGATPNIRTVSSHEFNRLKSDLLYKATKSSTYANGQGTWYDLPTGGRVGVRASDSSGVTLDIDIPGYPKGLKVHQQ